MLRVIIYVHSLADVMKIMVFMPEAEFESAEVELLPKVQVDRADNGHVTGKTKRLTPKSLAHNGRTRWRPDEDKFLDDHPEMSDAAAAKTLGRTAAAVNWRRWHR